MTIAMKRSVAAALTAHALAQIVGFAEPWWLEHQASPPNHAALIGEVAMEAMSILWLAVAIAFLVAAVAARCGAVVWQRITAGAAGCSLVLSVLYLPGSLLGIPINLTILLILQRTRGSASGRRSFVFATRYSALG